MRDCEDACGHYCEVGGQPKVYVKTETSGFIPWAYLDYGARVATGRLPYCCVGCFLH